MVVLGSVGTLVIALRTRNNVVRVQFAFTAVEVLEEEDRPLAIRASHDDIPRASFRREHRRTCLSGNRLVQAAKARVVVSVLSAKTNTLSFEPASVILESVSVL